jgi:hypothetical protein
MKRLTCLALFLFIAACTAAAPASTPTPAIAPELSVAEYPLTQPPQAESDTLQFDSSVGADPRSLHAAERLQQFPDTSCTVDGKTGLCTALGSDRLFATEDWTDPSSGIVAVTRNDQPLYQVSVGHASPINALRGLWAYEDHWAVETAHIRDDESAEEVMTPATGQVAVDGKSLNDQLGYEASFGFQTLGGKPFYFYKQDGKIDASYSGVKVPLGYDEIPHYNCCGESSLNPKIYPNLVTFLGRKGDAWYYTEIGVFSQP